MLLSYIKPITKRERAESGNIHVAILDLSKKQVSFYGNTVIKPGAYSANAATAFEEVLGRFTAGREL